MEKAKIYKQVLFSPAAITAAFGAIEKAAIADPEIGRDIFERDEPKLEVKIGRLRVEKGDVTWQHDSEAEFFTEIIQTPDSASYSKSIGSCSFRLHYHNSKSEVEIVAGSRAAIEAAYIELERHVDECRLPEPKPELAEPQRIFIGHGHSNQWRQLKDHLTDRHGYVIEAYEVGARAGHAVRDVLQDMLKGSSMALLVLTAEDKDENGDFHARENVVHETGLFQGRLGFSRAIVLMEEGVTEFSNLHGIEQIRFSAGNIRETFGDVLATIHRELG